MLATTSSATRPMPNHASWRTATLPPARPMCRLMSVRPLSTAKPRPMPMSGQSTFCKSRRSIPIIEPFHRSPGEPGDGHLLVEDRVEDLAGDRRRRFTAVAAALDEDDDHRLGVLHGRERREPRVVLALLGLRVGDDLRGARLAGDVEPRNL